MNKKVIYIFAFLTIGEIESVLASSEIQLNTTPEEKFIHASNKIKEGEFLYERANSKIADANELRKKIISENSRQEAKKLFEQVQKLESEGAKYRSSANDLALEGEKLARKSFYDMWKSIIPITVQINPIVPEIEYADKSSPQVKGDVSDETAVPRMDLIMGDDQPRPNNINYGSFGVSNQKDYFAHVESLLIPIQLNQMHAWVFTLIDSAAKPISSANIEILGHMPGHVHGMPTSPKVVKEISPGRYLVEGMKFQMQGWWVIEFTISKNKKSDHFIFNLEI